MPLKVSEERPRAASCLTHLLSFSHSPNWLLIHLSIWPLRYTRLLFDNRAPSIHWRRTSLRSRVWGSHFFLIRILKKFRTKIAANSISFLATCTEWFHTITFHLFQPSVWFPNVWKGAHSAVSTRSACCYDPWFASLLAWSLGSHGWWDIGRHHLNSDLKQQRLSFSFIGSFYFWYMRFGKRRWDVIVFTFNSDNVARDYASHILERILAYSIEFVDLLSLKKHLYIRIDYICLDSKAEARLCYIYLNRLLN